MAHNYLVTAHPATGALICETGNFTSPKDLNLLVAHTSKIEIMAVTPEGLRSKKEFSINGTIEAMKLYRPPGAKKDRLFVLTAKHNAMILEVEASGDTKMMEEGDTGAGSDDFEIVTRAFGDVGDKIGRKAETGSLAVIDPEARVIGLRLYDSLFKVIPLDKPELKAYNIRIPEVEIYDIKFLHGCSQPTIVLLHHDANGVHLKTHELCTTEYEFVRVPWKQDNVETDAHILIPVPEPYCGALIIGGMSITYHSGSYYHTIDPPFMKSSFIIAHARVDANGSRFLLGDMNGKLYMLLLESEGTTVKDMKLELLGETSIAESIAYLDNGYVYIGSRLGDSQLIRLNAEPDVNGGFVTIVDSFTNLGPILDMVVVDLEKQGQGQLVTCSGAYKDGSLRIIRNGIGINELATIDLPGIKGMWPLRCGGTEKDDTLVLSFVEQTRVLTLVGDEVEQIELSGFMSEQQTFFAGNTDSGNIMQVTPAGVRLMSGDGKQLVDQWSPPGSKQISVCGTNGSQILLASGSILFYLDIQKDKLVYRGDTTMEYEIACIDLSPLEEGEKRSEVACVGLWSDISVRLLRLLPTGMEEIGREYLGGEIIPRSVLLANFERVNYLLCALGDGTLFYFVLAGNGTLTDRKKVTLGTQPTLLRKFKTNATTTNVFACSDRPTVIYSSNQKLVFSNVNLKEVKHMCPLNAEAFRDSLALASDTSITIGTIDEIQKLHIRSIPLGEAPLRIAYQEETSTFGVISKRNDVYEKGRLIPSSQSISLQALTKSTASTQICFARGTQELARRDEGEEVDVHSLLIVDQHTFEVVHAHTFMFSEYAISITSCKLGDDPTPYYVVGTAMVTPEESEPNSGRLIIFSWADGKLTQVAEREIKGCPSAISQFNGKLLSNIGSTVRLWEWTHEKDLRLESSSYQNVVALYQKTSGDFILVGDLLRSMCLLQHKFMESSLEVIARDQSFNWMTAVEILDDDTFLGAEGGGNLFVCQRDSGANTDEERQNMTEIGRIHVGSMVNVFLHGSLVMQNLGDNSIPYTGSILLGSVDGSIKLLTQIPQEFFEFLSELQSRLCKKIKSVGRIDHSFWRRFVNEKKEEPAEGFIDGDVIESFLDLDRASMEEVCQNLHRSDSSGGKIPMSLEDTIKIVEDLTRIH